jgi:hypothetical protein
MPKKELPMIVPSIDLEVLQKAANEAAMKGALASIEEFYTGWNSPYRKGLNTAMENIKLDNSFQLPDIVALINSALSKEIDAITNTAISKTFLPLVKNILTRAEPEIRFSDILEKIIEFHYDAEDDDKEDYRVELEPSDGSFMYVEIFAPKVSYRLGFYKNREQNDVWEMFTLPTKKEDYSLRTASQTMKVTLDGVTLEMPFTKDVLSDNFVAYCARLVMCNTKITIKNANFDDDMFPERTCHC